MVGSSPMPARDSPVRAGNGDASGGATAAGAGSFVVVVVAAGGGFARPAHALQ
jgi:hypothetical protein